MGKREGKVGKKGGEVLKNGRGERNTSGREATENSREVAAHWEGKMENTDVEERRIGEEIRRCVGVQ